ncbi:MAG: bifunctional UDP-N-acetylglucosamine diphosphorylase/glucosamine-1-phosphate N-acetyltransferase GlmU [Steroidobacteraceae bacterium]|jgi:bifunctional UDP-N-acetylglucosamine pyrophosphorylase/glucosamine-1-phosphate N-acetyltransferase|nr:bifunctional UDP-N-acetylglucosamine diphosphorylase/glucosamine-1-phosphate N-acetyltransferase GlmU [Steroidobacteraceae bacterium]
MPLTIVILAAGQGKRMRSDLPKVLQPLAGRPLLSHVIATAQELEPSSIHVVYGHGGERVRDALSATPVSWVLQAEQLGTGHAVAQAMPQVDDGDLVLVLYGDVPLIRAATLRQLVAAAGPKNVALLTVELDDPAGYGRIVRNARGQVQRIVEEKDAPARVRRIREGNTGVMVAPAKLLRRWLARLRANNAQGELYLTDIIAMAVKEKVKVAPLAAESPGEVLGINDKAQLAAVEAIYRARCAEALLTAGVTLVDPARIDVRGTLAVGRDVQIDVNVIFEGTVRLGDRVRIGPNCVIRESEIGDDTEVFPNCVIDRATIGPACHIGPFARFRPSSKLARGVHVGNFVEVKNSVLGEGSKSNHLTYLGDAVIGARVNVGAGTVTCNYDGVNKSQTHIDDGAFIGSGSMLVAPVRVGARATIGAGSVITRDTPPDKLTLERAQQVTIDGWQRPTKKA